MFVNLIDRRVTVGHELRQVRKEAAISDADRVVDDFDHMLTHGRGITRGRVHNHFEYLCFWTCLPIVKIAFRYLDNESYRLIFYQTKGPD